MPESATSGLPAFARKPPTATRAVRGPVLEPLVLLDAPDVDHLVDAVPVLVGAVADAGDELPEAGLGRRPVQVVGGTEQAVVLASGRQRLRQHDVSHRPFQLAEEAVQPAATDAAADGRDEQDHGDPCDKPVSSCQCPLKPPGS